MTFYAYRMPGYPIFLAIIYSILGWNPLYAFVANIICDIVTLLFIFWIGSKLFNKKIALIAQAVFAIHVLWTPSLMTECLFTTIFIVLTFLLVTGTYIKSKCCLLL